MGKAQNFTDNSSVSGSKLPGSSRTEEAALASETLGLLADVPFVAGNRNHPWFGAPTWGADGEGTSWCFLEGRKKAASACLWFSASLTPPAAAAAAAALTAPLWKRWTSSAFLFAAASSLELDRLVF